MVTLEQLCERLGSDLRPATPGPIGRQQLTGVHISELADPTPYLEGGELLLTTGIPLVGGPAVIRDYVGRLAQRGIAALALGLGAGMDRVDPVLVSACADAALDLLLVPAATPFLQISRAFWQLVGQREQAGLASSLSLHTALARAATRDDPAQAIVTALAQGLGGWVAYLPANGGRETIWPSTAADVVPQLRAESARFDLVGTYSAATFPLNGMDVVEHSITIGQRTVGFLAVGTGRALRKADRQLILTSCMLLSLTAQGAEEASRVAEALGETIAVLILGGHVDAARVASEHAGRPPLGDFARLLAVRGRATTPVQSRELAAVIASLGLPQSALAATLTTTVGGIRLAILPETPASRGGSVSMSAMSMDPVSMGGAAMGGAAMGGPAYAIALGQPLPLAELTAAVGSLAFACRTASLGAVIGGDGSLGAADSLDARGDSWVDALARHPRGDLRDTVRSYLAHRGHWEIAARELGIHRNSLRHRIAMATELIDADLADPDTAAALWIALRQQRGVT